MGSRPSRGRLVIVALLAACGSTRAPSVDPSPPVSSTLASLSWSAAPPPTRVYAGHTATMLGDGRVLLAGGVIAGEATELFDPKRPGFVDGPKLLARRDHHTATMLLSGKVLLAGGTGLASAELFDPATGTSTATGSLGVVRAGHAAARLGDGRVLIVGGASSSGSAEIYDPTAGTFSAVQTVAGNLTAPKLVVLPSGKALLQGSNAGTGLVDAWSFDPDVEGFTPLFNLEYGWGITAVTLLADGRVLDLVVHRAVVGGSEVPTSVQLYDPGSGVLSPPSDTISGAQDGMTATLLPDGRVLFAAGTKESRAPVVYDPTTASAVLESTAAAFRDGTPVVLPGGDVLLVGGAAPAAEIRPWPGAVREPGLAITSRAYHVAVPLHDGTALLAGGMSRPESMPWVALASAEVFDPGTRSVTATAGPLLAPRVNAAAALLASGKALVLGGDDTLAGAKRATADLYDPATRSFRATGPMTQARASSATVRLASGEILVVGGGANTGTELFDPSSETFRAGPSTQRAHTDGRAGLVRLRDGRVLVVDAGSAELFDPRTSTFAATAAPALECRGKTARLLPDGKVLASSDGAAATQIFDPEAQVWSTAASLPFVASDAVWGLTPEGAPLMIGANRFGSGSDDRMVLFDPITPLAPAIVANDPVTSAGRPHATATLLPIARTLVAGGTLGGGDYPPSTVGTALLYGDGAEDARRPVLTSAPAIAEGGSTVVLHGSGLAAGTTPLAIWATDTGEEMVSGTVKGFTDTRASWVVPSTAFTGPGWLHVSVGGLTSNAVPLTITPARLAAACRFDAECATGHCTDGVCCDRACGGPNLCEACSAKKKGGGDDGTCAVLPFGVASCVAPDGTACSSNAECASGACASGVCCDTPCTGACLSCSLEGSRGTCRATPICDLACDGDHTLKKAGAADVSCAPYTCNGTSCRTTCASVADCVAPAVCDRSGTCVVLRSGGGAEQSMFGCAVGAPRGPRGGLLAVVAMVLGAALARRRRRP